MSKKKDGKGDPPEDAIVDVPTVDIDKYIGDPRRRLKTIGIILGILAAGSLVTCGVATLLNEKQPDVVVVEAEIPVVPNPPAAPVILTIEEVIVHPEVLQEVVLEPPEIPSYGVAPGFDCTFIIGGWSDAIRLDAEERSCDVVVVEYMGASVWYYDVGFDLMQDISHHYH